MSEQTLKHLQKKQLPPFVSVRYTCRMNTHTDGAPRALININRCSVSDGKQDFLPNITWTMSEGEQWVVTGTNGGGKSAFASALCGALDFVPVSGADGGIYANTFKDTTVVVSFEQAAHIIEEEKANDESEYIEGGVDIGRTARAFIAEALPRTQKGTSATATPSENTPARTQFNAQNLESHPAVQLLGIAPILDRGLKYLSTGEIRRTLLARALASEPDLLILDEPFEGLDVQSRENLRTFLAALMTSGAGKTECTSNGVAYAQSAAGAASLGAQNGENGAASAQNHAPAAPIAARDTVTVGTTCSESVDSVPSPATRPMHILLLMDRFDYVPNAVTHVLELARGEVSFCGTIGAYRKIVQQRAAETESRRAENKQKLQMAVRLAQREGILHRADLNGFTESIKDTRGDFGTNAVLGSTDTDSAPFPDSTNGAPSSTDTDSAHFPDSSSCDSPNICAFPDSNSSVQSPAPATSELIHMENVVVQWGEKRVLDNVTWTVRGGEHWLIRGPNGSGKTTLLELITGDNAQVFCNNVSLFGKRRGTGETIWELKEKMGIVSYRLHVDYRNFGSMSIENVVVSGLHDSVGLYEQSGEYEKQLARSWLDLCGFENRARDQFRTLSYGEQRAVLIARAAVKCPLLLILDEPCHGLDSESKTRILSILQTIAESGMTTLLHVTHDADEVLPCERRILELLPNQSPMYRILTR